MLGTSCSNPSKPILSSTLRTSSKRTIGSFFPAKIAISCVRASSCGEIKPAALLSFCELLPQQPFYRLREITREYVIERCVWHQQPVPHRARQHVDYYISRDKEALVTPSYKTFYNRR